MKENIHENLCLTQALLDKKENNKISITRSPVSKKIQWSKSGSNVNTIILLALENKRNKK